MTRSGMRSERSMKFTANRWRALHLVMLAITGAMALLLGLVGIYGVVSYSVSQRRREIGIRVALSARQQQVSGMFVRYG
jgi:ABC-type antimicrobial peptide transport system permease subunit